jgi:hypothetical protein
MDEYVKLKFLLVFSNIRLLYPCVFIGKLEKLIIKKTKFTAKNWRPHCGGVELSPDFVLYHKSFKKVCTMKFVTRFTRGVRQT